VSNKNGFTLIELIITVAIVGILASIAYPSYTNSLRKSNRSAAQSVLMDIAQRQSQYLVENRSYAASTSAVNVTVPSKVSSTYTITVTNSAGPPPSFTATATPIAGTNQVSDGVLTINNTGTKTPSNKW
jgi:type IV pilus assembly protein PilE